MGAPLDGVRVLEFTQVASGPLAGRMLAEYGAEVTKVEPPAGDVWRRVPQQHQGMAARFYSANRGKRSVVLDLKQARGVEVARLLAGRSDVVLENWRPGVAARLGLDWDALRAQHPRLITAAITGYGPTGPRAGERAYDVVLQGLSGIAHSQGSTERPEPTASVLVDKLAAMAAVQAVLAALLERERTGRGRHLAVSMLDVAVSFSWPDLLAAYTFVDAEPRTPEQARPPRTSAVVRAGDGRYLAFNSLTEENWRGICDVAGRADLFAEYRDLARRSRSTPQVVAELEEAFGGCTRDEVLDGLRARQVPCGPVHAYHEVLTDAQVVHNDIVRVVPREGLGPVREPAPMVRLTGDDHWLGPAPRLGQHTDAVLAEAGLGAGEIRALRDAGVTGVPAGAATTGASDAGA